MDRAVRRHSLHSFHHFDDLCMYLNFMFDHLNLTSDEMSSISVHNMQYFLNIAELKVYIFSTLSNT